jgi:cell division protein FtsL
MMVSIPIDLLTSLFVLFIVCFVGWCATFFEARKLARENHDLHEYIDRQDATIRRLNAERDYHQVWPRFVRNQRTGRE